MLMVESVGNGLRKRVVLLTSMLMVINALIDSDISLVFDIYFVIMFLFLPVEGIVELLCFLFPLVNMFEVSHVMLAALAIMIFKRRTINVSSAFFIVFFASLELAAHFVYGVSGFNRVIGYMVTVAVLFYLTYENLELIDRLRCIRCFVYGVAILFGVYFLNMIVMEGTGAFELILSGKQRFGATASKEFTDMKISLNANMLAYYSVCGITAVLVLNSNDATTKMKRIVLWGLASLFGFFGVITISRSWVLVLAIVLMIYVLFCERNAVSRFTRLVTVGLVCLIAVWVLSKQTTLIESLVLRFQSEGIETGGGRVTTSLQYLKAFFETDSFILMGTGVTDYGELIYNQFSIHNGLIQILVCLGVPGALVMIAALYTPTVKAVLSRTRIIYFLPIIAVLCFTQTIQFLNPNSIMLPYIIGVFALQLGTLEEKGGRQVCKSI